MATKTRALGRGLDALLGGQPGSLADLNSPVPPTAVEENTDEEAAASTGEQVREIPVDLIRRCAFQPRRSFDETALKELGESIAKQGLIQPILLRAVGEGYELVAGERRWRATQLIGSHTIKAIVRTLSDEDVAAQALIENVQRKDLNPIEEAQALQRLIEEFGNTHAQVAASIGRSRAAVTNLLRLLDLHKDVQLLVEQDALSMGHARALIPLEQKQQLSVADQVIQQQLSVRATEALVKSKLLDRSAPEKAKDTPVDPNIRELAENLSEKIGAQVSIKQGNKGKGQLVISYDSLIQLDGILSHIK